MTVSLHNINEAELSRVSEVQMSGSVARAFAVFCIVLGATYGIVKFLRGPPELLYLAPMLVLIYLGADILVTGWRLKPRAKSKHTKAKRVGK